MGSVDKSRDTHSFIETSHSMQSVPFLFHNAPILIPCNLWWQITCNCNNLNLGHCNFRGHHKLPNVGIAGDHGHHPWKYLNHVFVSGARIVFPPVKFTENKTKMMGFTFRHFLQLIKFRFWVEFMIGQFILEFPFSVQIPQCVGRRDLKFTHCS